jgi:hypothetical protein
MEVFHQTPNQWEDVFRKERDPIREIAIWDLITNIFESINKRHNHTSLQRRELLTLLLTCSRTQYEHLSLVFTPQRLKREVANEAVQEYYGQPELKKQAAMKPACEYLDPLGNPPRSVENLRDLSDDEREALEEAEVIFSVDSFSGEARVFYGRTIIDEVRATGKRIEVDYLSYLLDSRTEQLELLAAVVEEVKGSCDYGKRT